MVESLMSLGSEYEERVPTPGKMRKDAIAQKTPDSSSENMVCVTK